MDILWGRCFFLNIYIYIMKDKLIAHAQPPMHFVPLVASLAVLFSLSRSLEDSDDIYSVGSSGRFLPLRWLSPETMISKCHSRASDVWAFGVLMWEAMSKGDLPYSGILNKDLKQHLLGRNHLTPPPQTPERMKSLMIKCWEFDEEHRPSFTEIHETMKSVYEELILSLNSSLA